MTKQIYKPGDKVEFARVTRKYACRGGIIRDKITLYTDDTLKYPTIDRSNPHSNAINVYRENANGRKSMVGYIVDAINYSGDHISTVTVTDSFIFKVL